MSWEAARTARHPFVSNAQYIERWKAKCTITEKGCWQWRDLGRHPRANGPNYPEACYRNQRYRLNRAMVMLTQRPLLKGEMALHKCDNHLCINPDHLFIGTNRDNLLDASRKGRMPGQAKTHCDSGHEFTPENTYLCPRGNGITFRRVCRECGREKNRRERENGIAAERQRRRKARIKLERLSQSENARNER